MTREHRHHYTPGPRRLADREGPQVCVYCRQPKPTDPTPTDLDLDALAAASAAVRADPSPFGFDSVALSPDTLDALIAAARRASTTEPHEHYSPVPQTWATEGEPHAFQPAGPVAYLATTSMHEDVTPGCACPTEQPTPSMMGRGFTPWTNHTADCPSRLAVEYREEG